MKKIIFCIPYLMLLIGCNHDAKQDAISADENKGPTTFYSIDGFTGEYDITELLLFSAIYVNGKTYNIDQNGKIYISYQGLPIFKTEVIRRVITPEQSSYLRSQHLDGYRYVLGRNASFNGQTLKYTINDEQESRPLSVTWTYLQKDVSGLPIVDDINNPIHKINLSPTSQIFASVLGSGYEENQVFPKGSICWQKISAQSNQEYIEYYPEKNIRHVKEDQQILRTGKWNNVEWTEFQLSNEDANLANIRIVEDGKIYWGFYHSGLDHIATNQLKCDLMNEVAYNVAISGLNQYKEALQKDDVDASLLHLIWQPSYLDQVDLNPQLAEIDIESGIE